MSYFLWVEDFDNAVRVTASNVFGGLGLDEGLFDDKNQALKHNFKSQGVFIELNFQDGLDFICSKLDSIDYVILDIDLPAYGDDGINNAVLELLINYEGYQIQENESEDELLRNKACSELKKIAGFYLYTKLVVELGFPKEHILFCSDNGENTKTIQGAFKTARMALPKIYQKSDDVVQQWVKQRYDDPYSRLRRGIIEGCRHAKSLIKDKLYFNNYTSGNDVSPDDLTNYFDVLESFLPLRQPEDKQTLYKLFVRTLSHEWESAKNIKPDPDKKPDAMLAWIMRNTRHWVTHNSGLFSQTDEQLITFLFVVNVRAMLNFDDFSVQNHEKILLRLFKNKALDESDFSQKYRPISDAYLELRNLILDENKLLSKGHKIEEAFYFNDMANNIQLSKSKLRIDKKLFAKLLYQMFWLMLCNSFVDKKNKNSLEIKFWNFDFSDKPYLFELARHIYHRSFPQA